MELAYLHFFSVTMERSKSIRKLREVRHKSSNYWINGTNEVEVEERTTRIGQPTMHDSKMDLVYGKVLEVLKPSNEYTSTGFEVCETGDEK